MRSSHVTKLADSAPKGLSTQQTEFLQTFSAAPFMSQAAICKQLGIKQSLVSRWKKDSDQFKRALDAEYLRSQRVADMSRKSVMRGILEAVEIAKDMRQPSSMISGYKEIGRMCGFYEPERREIKLSVDNKQMLEQLQTLPKAKLIELMNDPLEAEFEVIDGEQR